MLDSHRDLLPRLDLSTTPTLPEGVVTCTLRPFILDLQILPRTTFGGASNTTSLPPWAAPDCFCPDITREGIADDGAGRCASSMAIGRWGPHCEQQRGWQRGWQAGQVGGLRAAPERRTDCYYGMVWVSPPVPDYIRNPRSGTHLDVVHVFRHKQPLIIASPTDCLLVATQFSLAFNAISAKGGYIRKVLSLIKDLDASSKVSLLMISAVDDLCPQLPLGRNALSRVNCGATSLPGISKLTGVQ